MPEEKLYRVFATCDIGQEALDILRQHHCQVEVYDRVEAPPKTLVVEKVKSGIDGLTTTLLDRIDEEVFAAGKGTLKVVAQIAVGFDNIDRAAANRFKIPFTNTADVLTEATAEFAFFMMGALARKLYPSERLVREQHWGSWQWHPYHPFLGDEVTGKTVSVLGTGRIGKAFIKKCLGLDMNILCYDPVYDLAGLATELELASIKANLPANLAAGQLTLSPDALAELDGIAAATVAAEQ